MAEGVNSSTQKEQKTGGSNRNSDRRYKVLKKTRRRRVLFAEFFAFSPFVLFKRELGRVGVSRQKTIDVNLDPRRNANRATVRGNLEITTRKCEALRNILIGK